MRYCGFNCQIVRKREGKAEKDAYTEFGVTEDRNTRTITCWIACQAGDEFSLVWRDERRQSELDGLDGSKGAHQLVACCFRRCLTCTGTVRIDGQVCGKRESTDDHPQRFWGCSVGDGLKQPLLFSDAIEGVTTDEFEARADEGRLSGLGAIEVIIQRGVVEQGANTKIRHKKFADGTPEAVLRRGPRYFEEAKVDRDISHTVKFGRPIATSNYGKFRFKDFAGGMHPDRVGWLEPNAYVTFHFKYRSREFLKAAGHLVDDGVSTVRNLTKSQAQANWDKSSKTWADNVEIIEVSDDDEDDDSDGMDVDSRYDRGRSHTRFSTAEPPSDPAAMEHERQLLRAKLEI